MPSTFYKASTGSGQINKIDNMFIHLPNGEFNLHALPEISESKTARYSDVPILGRASPIKTYSHSDFRSFNITFHLHSLSEDLAKENMEFIRGIAALVHPIYSGTYLPPPLAFLSLGSLISEVFASCTSYTVPFNIDAAWITSTDVQHIPLHVPLQAEFHVMYAFALLPGSNDVIEGKY